MGWHYINVPRSKEAEHETIVYCKDHPDVKVIKAIGLVINEMRSKRGIELSKNEAILLMAPFCNAAPNLRPDPDGVGFHSRLRTPIPILVINDGHG